MSSIENIIQSADSLSRRFANLSNNYRILILAYLIQRKEATWSEIKQFLDNVYGSINPNTLHFHLKALINSDMIRWSGSEEKSIYLLGNIPNDISDAIKNKIPLEDYKLEIRSNEGLDQV